MSDGPSQRELAEKHLRALLAEADAAQFPRDGLARTLLWMVIDIYRESRTIEDIQNELAYVMDNLDPNADLIFMRP